MFSPRKVHENCALLGYTLPRSSLVHPSTVEIHLSGSRLSGTPIIRIGLALRVNLSRMLKKLTCLDITSYRIKYSTVLWLMELEIMRGREV